MFNNLIELVMKADFRDERGMKKFRVTSCTTIMQRDIRKELKKEENEARRIARLQERNDKKYEGMDSLF